MATLQHWFWKHLIQVHIYKLPTINRQATSAARHISRTHLSTSRFKSLSSSSSSSFAGDSSVSSISKLESNPQISLSTLRTLTTTSPLVGEIDSHNGIIVYLEQLKMNLSADSFSVILKDSLDIWRTEGRAAAWLSIPFEHCHLITTAADQGFQFHHAEGSHCMMKLWLRPDKPDLTPRFATHQLGVSGIVLREDRREVLVVQDKNRPYTLWKFPGGLSDLGEDIDCTAVREVFEETGIQTEFQSVLAFRQQHKQPGAFGRSDFYVICRLRPLTFELRPCKQEIRLCRWMTVEELRSQRDISSMTLRLTDLLLRGLDNGFDDVDLDLEQHRSVYRGMTFKVFFRPLGRWLTK